jgi:hypothetical protein
MKWHCSTAIPCIYIFATVLIQVSFPHAGRGTIFLERGKIDFRGEYGQRLDSIILDYNHRLDSFVQKHQKEFLKPIEL